MATVRTALAALFIVCLSSCVGGRDVPHPELVVRDVALGELQPGKPFEVEAWAVFAGELRLYDNERAADLGLLYPYCISASFADYDRNRALEIRDRLVRATGTIFRAEQDEPDLPPNTIRTMLVVKGIIYANSCWGPFVLQLESIEPTSARSTGRGPHP